jgi:hypothetical protein
VDESKSKDTKMLIRMIDDAFRGIFPVRQIDD